MNRNIITAAITSIAHNDVDSAHDIQTLQRECKGMAREDIKALLMPIYAAAVGITLTVKTTGAAVWPKDDPRSGAAKRTFNNHLASICGVFAAHTVELDVPEDVLSAARRLVKLCAQYEGAAKLVQAAIKAAK